jgi:hypothetical protein
VIDRPSFILFILHRECARPRTLLLGCAHSCYAHS